MKKEKKNVAERILFRQHEYNGHSISIAPHASLNIHEPKGNVNRFQRPTKPYIPKANKTIQIMEEGTLLVWNIKAVREGKTAQEGNPYHRKRRNPMKTTLASRAFLIRNRKKQPVLRGAKPSDGLLGRGSSPHRTGCCIPYDGTGRNRLHAARYRNVHTRVTNILPLSLSILGANFSLFLRFKGPASKGTGIDPRVRFQGPFFKKTRPDVGLCARPLKNHVL